MFRFVCCSFEKAQSLYWSWAYTDKRQAKGLDVITLFHKPSLPASLKVYSLLKQAAATASEHATEDQASDHSHQTHTKRVEFELDVTENAPTVEQVRSILEYVGAQRAGEIIKGAKDEADGMKKLKESQNNFQYPVVSMCQSALRTSR